MGEHIPGKLPLGIFYWTLLRRSLYLKIPMGRHSWKALIGNPVFGNSYGELIPGMPPLGLLYWKFSAGILVMANSYVELIPRRSLLRSLSWRASTRILILVNSYGEHFPGRLLFDSFVRKTLLGSLQ